MKIADILQTVITRAPRKNAIKTSKYTIYEFANKFYTTATRQLPLAG